MMTPKGWIRAGTGTTFWWARRDRIRLIHDADHYVFDLSLRELGPTPSRRVVKTMNPLLFVIARSEATWRSI
jgi:hypothetical protein